MFDCSFALWFFAQHVYEYHYRSTNQIKKIVVIAFYEMQLASEILLRSCLVGTQLTNPTYWYFKWLHNSGAIQSLPQINIFDTKKNWSGTPVICFQETYRHCGYQRYMADMTECNSVCCCVFTFSTFKSNAK